MDELVCCCYYTRIDFPHRCPFIIYKLYPPTVKETPNAKKWATEQLEEMGHMSIAEKLMVGIFIIALALWVLGSFINVDATLTAFIALALLLLTGVLAWSDILNETGAWNTPRLVLSSCINGRTIKQVRLYPMVKQTHCSRFEWLLVGLSF